MTRPCPFEGQYVVRRLRFNMINLSTKFEVSMFTHYEDTKGNAKCRKWSGFGRLGVTQGHRQHKRSIKCILFPIQLNRNYASILYHFRITTSYLSKQPLNGCCCCCCCHLLLTNKPIANLNNHNPNT